MESYFLINTTTNIVENTIDWNGVDSWNVPDGYILVSRDSTPAKIWLLNEETRNFDLVTVLGAGDIGFLWDGSELMTNQAQPEPLKPIKIVPLPTEEIVQS
jgi:hypothetical protein